MIPQRLFQAPLSIIVLLHVVGTQAIASDTTDTTSYICQPVDMPSSSHFLGFSAPSDATKWMEAQRTVCEGKLVLLHKVFTAVKRIQDLYSPDRAFRWNHHLADVFLINGMDFDAVNQFTNKSRAPIVHFGKRTFERENYKGPLKSWNAFSPHNVADFSGRLPRKIVAIGAMDENWGWLSTNFLNRTVSWGLRLTKQNNKFPQDVMQNFLDDPNLLMLVVNQHNNVSHPKVISMPLGVASPKPLAAAARRLLSGGDSTAPPSRKLTLLMTGGSNYGARPAIRDCVDKNMKGKMEILTSRMPEPMFFAKMGRSVAVLCMPGLGYDTYRLWETLVMGAIPVIERGLGLDRTLYKLPALIVDDFAEVTPEVIRSAYVEAVYRADEWEYERLTISFWRNLIRRVADEQSTGPLLQAFPEKTIITDFTRPLFPFDCDKVGGCGRGTKRTPRKYCGIDTSRDWNKYVFGHFNR